MTPLTGIRAPKSSRTELDDDVVDVTSLSALDVVEIKGIRAPNVTMLDNVRDAWHS